MRIEHFVDQKCWIGVDLASSLDPCAIGFVFELPNNMVAVFVKYYLPMSSPTFQDPDMVGTYESWASDGFLTASPGVLHDHAKIEEDLVEASEVFDVQHIAFDPYQSNMLMKTLWDRDLPVGRYPNNAMTMTAPTDDFIGRVVGKTVRHDGNPVLAWNVANMYGERKGNGSILPRKEVPNSPRKIDGAVALIMANGVRMNPDNLRKDEKELPKRSVYQSRGLIGYSDAN
jgi:phage terminase large subunit-like protein